MNIQGRLNKQKQLKNTATGFKDTIGKVFSNGKKSNWQLCITLMK